MTGTIYLDYYLAKRNSQQDLRREKRTPFAFPILVVDLRSPSEPAISLSLYSIYFLSKLFLIMAAVPPARSAFEAGGAGALTMPAVAPTSYAQFYRQAPDP